MSEEEGFLKKTPMLEMTSFLFHIRYEVLVKVYMNVQIKYSNTFGENRLKINFHHEKSVFPTLKRYLLLFFLFLSFLFFWCQACFHRVYDNG